MADDIEREDWSEPAPEDRLDQIVLVGRLRVPASVELDEDKQTIRWVYPSLTEAISEGEAGGLLVAPDRSVLRDFVDLASLKDAELPTAVVGYARRWGVLLLCEHSKPYTHDPRQWVGKYPLGCRPRAWRQDSDSREHGEEPIQPWMEWATRFANLITIIASLREGEKDTAQYWEHVLDEPDVSPLPWFRKDTLPGWWRDQLDSEQFQWNLALRTVHGWMEMGTVRPHLVLTPCRSLMSPRFAFQWSGALFGMLSFKLLQALAGTAHIVLCDFCLEGFISNVKPRTDRRNQCPTCKRKKASRRTAEKRYKAKQRAPARSGSRVRKRAPASAAKGTRARNHGKRRGRKLK